MGKESEDAEGSGGICAGPENGAGAATSGPLLYFAYGSNLDVAQMATRCPESAPIGPARLEGYRLAFGGYSRSRLGGVATVLEDAPGDYVQGLLYTLTAPDLKRLDRYENVPNMYRRFDVQVTGADQRAAAALTYQLVRYRPTMPADAYRDQIATAFAAHGFDATLLRRALAG